jgi:hypothetical protein
LRKTILDSQVFSIYPVVVSQPIKQRKLCLIERLSAGVTYGKKTKPTTFSLRARRSWQNEQCRSSRCYELPPLHSILIAA